MCNSSTLRKILTFIPKEDSFYGYLEERLKVQEAISAYIKKKTEEYVARRRQSKLENPNDNTPIFDSCGTSLFKVWELESGMGSTFWVEGMNVKKSFFYDYEDGICEGKEQPSDVADLLESIRQHRDKTIDDQQLYEDTLPEEGPTLEEIFFNFKNKKEQE